MYQCAGVCRMNFSKYTKRPEYTGKSQSCYIMDSPVFDLFNFENYTPEWGNVSDQELVGHVEQFEEKEKENSRFAALNDSELQEIVADAEIKGTKTNTKWFVKTFEGKYKNIAKHTYFLKYYNTFNCVHIQKLYSTFTLLFLLFLFTDWCRNRRVANRCYKCQMPN